jgi:hypothetical protein
MRLPDIKGFVAGTLDILYAGDLAYVQRLQQRLGNMEHVNELQEAIWAFPPEPNDEAEFLVVDHDWGMFVVDKHGAAVPCTDFGVVGSEFGWACMHMVEAREDRTMKQAKRIAAKVLRAVAKCDDSVEEPFRYKELAW